MHRVSVEGIGPCSYCSLKESFIQVSPGKPASGEIEIPLRALKDTLARELPKALGDKPPELFVVIDHQPSDRGEQHGLDAWVGSLWTAPIKVVPAEW
jgi:hypothetical protein